VPVASPLMASSWPALDSRMSRRHAGLLVLGVVAVSFSAIFIRLADAPALSIAFWRTAIASGLLLPLAIARHRDEIRRLSASQWVMAILSGVLLAAHFATWIPSLDYISVGASTVLVTTQPVWVAVIGRALGERVDPKALVGIALSLAGAVVIFGPDLGSPNAKGDTLALLGAITASGYLLSGRSLRRRVSLLTYVGIAYTVCALTLAVVVAVAGEPFGGFPATAWLLFLAMALGPQILGHTVFNYLLSDVDPGVISIAITAEPVGSTLLALAFFGEVPPWTTFVGGALILAGIGVTVRARDRDAVPEAPLD
jgi:drug/metabolite transporter (DMT)-like permease